MLHDVTNAICRSLEILLLALMFACSMWLTCCASWLVPVLE